MRKNKIISVILILALLLSLPALAVEDRASDQISRRDITVTPLSGQIAVKATVVGLGSMLKIGCESIYVYELVNSRWVLSDWLTEEDAGMVSTNVAGHMGNYYFNSNAGTEYRVSVTIFAENSAGRDSRTDTFYVTGE